MLKNCTQNARVFGQLNSGHMTGKCQFSFQSQRRAMLNNVQTIVQLHSFHMLARLGSKSFKLRFNSTCTENFQMHQLNLEKADLWSKRSNCSHSLDHRKSKSFTKIFTSLTTIKHLSMWITTNCGNSFKKCEYQITLSVF